MIERKLLIEVEGPGETATSGSLRLKELEKGERRARALRIIGKVYSRLAILPVVALFVHPLILVTIATWSLALLALPFVYVHFAEETAVWDEAQGQCPRCGSTQGFRPYLKKQIGPRISVLCRECGEASQARVDLSI
jgi:hypothetical protein